MSGTLPNSVSPGESKKSSADSESGLFEIGQRTDWLGATQSRRRRLRRWISLSHHLTFWMGQRFPATFPLVFVIGYPKSGTSWVCQLMADCLRLPFPQHSVLPIGCAAVVHGHDLPTARMRRGVYVVRDGRDVVVSSYFHVRNQVQAGGGKRKDRSFFARHENRELRELLPEFIEHHFRNPFGCRHDWATHLRSFEQIAGSEPLGPAAMPMLKYELLLEDPVSVLAQAVESVAGQQFSAEHLAATVERFDFANQAGRSRGTDNTSSYLRSGKAGGWRKHFSRAAAEKFDQLYGDALIAAGYENDRQWVEEVEP